MGRVRTSQFLWLFFLSLCLWGCLLALRMSYFLVTLKEYRDITMLLQQDGIQSLYFVRVILANLDYRHITVLSFLGSLFQALSIRHMCMILLFLFLWAASKERWFTYRYGQLCKVCIVYVLGYVVLAFILFWRFQSTSLGAVMQLFSLTGIIYGIMHFAMLWYCLIELLRLIKEIKHSFM